MSWYEDDDLWIALAPVYRSAQAIREADGQVQAAMELAGVIENTKVLDFGCGPGRHALALAQRGYAVTGVDRTPSYLTHLTSVAKKRHVSIEVVRRDLRDFSRNATYDAAICVDTLDVFDSEADHEQVLTNLYQALVPGGCAVIAVQGKEVLARHHSDKDWAWLRPGTVLLDERKMSSDFGRLRSKLSIVEGGRIRKFDRVLWVFSASELKRLLDKVGFSAARVYGDFDGRPYDRAARRLVAVAER